ncbi:MAG: biotin/lipoyl-binding protein, partial [Spirulina sp. DLM2.Bin59]
MKGRTVISELKRRKNLIGLVLLGMVILGGSVVYALALLREPTASAPEESQPEPARVQAITALGRIEPLGQVIAVSAPPALGGAKVERLLVAEGDRVAVDQIIAQLDNYERLQAALETARQDLTVAEAALNIVQAGAKTGAIQAAEARIATLISQQQGQRRTNQATAERLQAALNTAQLEYNRYQFLYTDGVVSASDRDQRQLAWITAQKELAEAVAAAREIDTTLSQQIREAQADRDRIAEVRPVEVAQARAQVGQAEARVRQAVTDLELGIVRSPITGQVIKI